MSNKSILLAKVAALKKNFDEIEYGRSRCLGNIVEPLFPRYENIIKQLTKLYPNLYDDLPKIKTPKSIGNGAEGALYERYEILPYIQNLNYILELNSNIRIGENQEDTEKKNKVFITHGQSNEWYKIQSYLEKDLNIATTELAQQPNVGRTILQKLNDEADECSVAVIVMTGDDILKDGEVRARENVMHEIGFFQGKYGLNSVVLLHEEGVNIPSNIHGLVYISFPKDTVEAAQGALTREMKVLIKNK